MTIVMVFSAFVLGKIAPRLTNIGNPSSGTQFDMIGTFSIVYVPCAVNVQCNPQYQLAGTDGNSYQLIFIVSIPPECSVGCHQIKANE